MKEEFNVLLNEYLNDDSILVDSDKNYYIEFVKNLPEYLYNYFGKEKYLIKASVGAGQKSEIPWLCIFNKNVTTSATKGIYICYLFRSDMSGFYLALGQGITTFEELYGKEKYNNIKKVAKYFKNLIDDNNFSKNYIDLKGTKSLAKGYEAGTIISKYYEKEKYSEKELIRDLINLKDIYDEICENMVENTYMDIVSNVVGNIKSSYIIAEEADKMLKETLKEENKTDEKSKVFLEKVDIPKYKKKNKYEDITKKTIKKIDYLKKAKSNANNGLLGEELVIAYEIERLTKLGRKDLAQKIKWVSKEDDTIGYDIISFDIGKFNIVYEKYIEVKSTEENDTNAFYISANELNVMEELKEQYFIYRVFKVKSSNPKLFILDYDEFKNRIDLTVENYAARIKECLSEN